MSKIKYLKIKELNSENVNDMFDSICADVLNMTPLKAKRTVLGLTGKDANIDKHRVTINQLLALIVRFDIPTEIKVSYVDSSVREDEIAPAAASSEGLKKDIISEAMNEQKSFLNKPEIPDVPDFL